MLAPGGKIYSSIFPPGFSNIAETPKKQILLILFVCTAGNITASSTMAKVLANEAEQRGLKDFLTIYNTITEYCFNKCVSKFNERAASPMESSCVDICAQNYVNYNQRFMFNFADHQGRRQRDSERVAAEAAAKEQEEQQKQLQQAAAAFAAGQEQAAADMAAASASSSSGVPDIPLKTGQAAELLESLASASGTAPSLANSSQSHSEPVPVAASTGSEQEVGK